MQLAERMTRIGIESAFEVLQRARALEAQGKNIIHLEIGQPDFPTPRTSRTRRKQALDEGWTGYGPTPGFPDFRDAIAEYISRTRGISVTGKNVVRRARRQADHVLHDDGGARAGRRGDLSESRASRSTSR